LSKKDYKLEDLGVGQRKHKPYSAAVEKYC